jgi:hypothetical protein
MSRKFIPCTPLSHILHHPPRPVNPTFRRFVITLTPIFHVNSPRFGEFPLFVMRHHTRNHLPLNILFCKLAPARHLLSDCLKAVNAQRSQAPLRVATPLASVPSPGHPPLRIPPRTLTRWYLLQAAAPPRVLSTRHMPGWPSRQCQRGSVAGRADPCRCQHGQSSARGCSSVGTVPRRSSPRLPRQCTMSGGELAQRSP